MAQVSYLPRNGRGVVTAVKTLFPALLVGALVGFAANIAFTLTLARLYIEKVMARVKRVE